MYLIDFLEIKPFYYEFTADSENCMQSAYLIFQLQNRTCDLQYLSFLYNIQIQDLIIQYISFKIIRISNLADTSIVHIKNI